MRDQPLKVAIEDEEIVIRIGIARLAHGVEWCDRLVHLDEASGEYVYPKVTNVDLFAAEVVRELESHEEGGLTPLHKLLDEAAVDAVEDGAEGIEIPGAYP